MDLLLKLLSLALGIPRAVHGLIQAFRQRGDVRVELQHPAYRGAPAALTLGAGDWVHAQYVTANIQLSNFGEHDTTVNTVTMWARAPGWRAKADRTVWPNGLPYRLVAGGRVTRNVVGEFHSSALPAADIRGGLVFRHSFGKARVHFAVDVEVRAENEPERHAPVITRRPSWPVLFWRLLFNVRQFAIDAAQHIGKPEDIPRMLEKAHLVRRTIVSGLLTAFGSIALGFLSGLGLARILTPFWASVLSTCAFLLSALLICWAVLGLLGWEIQTWRGATLPEQANQKWYRVLTILATFLLSLGLALTTYRD